MRTSHVYCSEYRKGLNSLMAGKIWTEILTVHVGRLRRPGWHGAGLYPISLSSVEAFRSKSNPAMQMLRSTKPHASGINLFVGHKPSFGSCTECSVSWRALICSFGLDLLTPLNHLKDGSPSLPLLIVVPFTTIVIAVGMLDHLRYFSAMIVGYHDLMFPSAAVVMCDEFISQQTDVLALQPSYRFVFKNLGSWRVKFVEQTDDG
jgi:hypothetical protein